MSWINLSDAHDRLRVGFAIGAGCLLGAPTEVFSSICELLLANGYKRQYDFVRFLMDDLNSDIDNDVRSRHTELIHAVIKVRDQYNIPLCQLIEYFESHEIDLNSFNKFLMTNGNKVLWIGMIVAVRDCLIHFENFAQIPDKLSDDLIESMMELKLTDKYFELMSPVLILLILGYQFIPYPLHSQYDNITQELEITLPYDIRPRAISYRDLFKTLGNIEPYRRPHLRIMLTNVRFTSEHYDCILTLKKILREFNVIRELRVDFEWQQRVRVESDEPWLRCLIITRILSMTNVKEINFSDVQWWYSHLDRDIRTVKLEDNALYAPMLPIFASLRPKCHSFCIEQLNESLQDASNKQLELKNNKHKNRRLNA